MKPIELRGVNHANKGAELMLGTIVKHLRETQPHLIPSMPFRESSFSDRAKDGVGSLVYFQQSRFAGMDRITSGIMRAIPTKARSKYKIFGEFESEAALDASGFRYSDQWSAADLAHSVKRVLTYRRRNKPFIFMPQAFGPFRNAEYKSHVRDLVQSSTLVFARDAQSYNYLRSIAGDAPHLKLAPDFTNLVEVDHIEDVFLPERSLVLVPNSRMLDKAGPAVAESYLPFLAAVASAGVDKNLTPVILVHDAAEDLALARKLQAQLPFRIQVIFDADPVRLKAYLGKAHMVISSRFHAIVGALSLGVPTIALGWSHKYEELMNDYGLGNLSVRIDQRDLVIDTLNEWADDKKLSPYKITIREYGDVQKFKSKQMWAEIDGHLSKLV